MTPDDLHTQVIDNVPDTDAAPLCDVLEVAMHRLLGMGAETR